MNQAQIVSNVADAEWRDGLGGEVLSRKWHLRAIINAALAVIAAKWIGWWALAWLAACTLDQYLYPWTTAKLAARFGRKDPGREEILRAIVKGFGASLQCLLWLSVWMVAGADGGFFAGVLLTSAIIPALVYFPNSLPMFLATVAPPVLIGSGVQLFVHPEQALVWMVAPVLLATALRVHWIRKDQLLLLATVDRNRAMRRAAEEANVAKSQFLAMMSHELRTPLNAVTGYAEILEEDLRADGKKDAAGDAGRIRRAARDLLALINEVLDLSKIEAGRMEVSVERTNMADIVADVVETTAHIAEANGDVVKVEIDTSVGDLMVDGPKVRQCLLNLVSNACKFTNDGVIEIQVRVEDVDGGAILHAVVSDTGVGISPDQAGKLFRPFVQADSSLTRSKGGTGLGLVITRRLAQLMGGEVTMQSALGQGSRFVLTIAAARPDDSAITSRGDAPLVLVIEDENAARDLVRRALARLPLNVLCAANAAEGMRLASRQAPALIILDIHLPDGTGWDLLAEFKADPALAETPVLIVSVDDNRARAMSLGACEHLVKPVDRERLAAAVMRFIRIPTSVKAA
jgi:signal transduction histidine kinase/CheY-like chemotaxis protein